MAKKPLAFSFEIGRDAGVFVVTVQGHLNSPAAKGFEESMQGLLDDGAERVVLDCRKLSYIGSAGLRIVLTTARELQRREGRLALCNLVSHLADIFRLSGMHRIIPMLDSLDSALAAARG